MFVGLSESYESKDDGKKVEEKAKEKDDGNKKATPLQLVKRLKVY